MYTSSAGVNEGIAPFNYFFNNSVDIDNPRVSLEVPAQIQTGAGLRHESFNTKDFVRVHVGQLAKVNPVSGQLPPPKRHFSGVYTVNASSSLTHAILFWIFLKF